MIHNVSLAGPEQLTYLLKIPIIQQKKQCETHIYRTRYKEGEEETERQKERKVVTERKKEHTKISKKRRDRETE